MIDLKDYEENKAQRCWSKWSKIPMVQKAMSHLDQQKQEELSVKLEENRISFFKEGTEKFVDNMMKFVHESI